MGVMCELGTKGDVEVKWDPNKPEDVDRAREAFVALRAKGFTAFRTSGPDKKFKGEQIFEFDPKAERIIMVPQIRGGCPWS